MSSNSTILGAAGEHYVMYRLLRQGMIAALAPAGVPDADIVVTDRLGSRLCAIQVKVRRAIGRDGGWHMKKKHEDIRQDMLYYCFVDLGAEEIDRPKCWVVPSAIVATALQRGHANWLAMPGMDRPHKDSTFRRFLPDNTRLGLREEYGPGWLDKYLEAWRQIGSASKI
jgi:hypothetical protein